MEARPTASIIIIGDEILKGETKDTNSRFLCRELYAWGVKVLCISVITDDIDVIAEEVLEHSTKYTFVITSGGIGPTHDDVTYEGVAKAFNEKLILNNDLQNILMKLDGPAAFKMSHVPESSEIHYTNNSRKAPSIPIVSVRNVFIFPGIPSYLEFAFLKLKHVFCRSAVPYFSQNLYISVNEFDITDILNKAVDEYEHRVKFGSYPDVENEFYRVKLTLEADSENAIMEAEAFLRSHLAQNFFVGKHPPNSEEALELMMSICSEKKNDKEFARILKESLKVLEECFNKYSVEGVCLSFNGGKDCTVLLHLTYVFLAKKFPFKIPRLKVLYVDSKHPFPEIKQFINLCVQRYNLELFSYEQPIKVALRKLQVDQPQLQAVLMGSRRTDPHCSQLQPFQVTDGDWPQFMRINPLSDWSYPQVWKFLRIQGVPYCSLYDRGYTSLGCQHNTLPNEQLLAKTKDGESYYLPAYLLKEPNQEREGRSVFKA